MAGSQKVFLRIVGLIGDSGDPDELPDRVSVSGRGRLIPTIAAGTGDVAQGPDSLHEIRLIEPVPFDIIDGMLTYDAKPYVWLPVPTGEWMWRITFDQVSVGEQLRELSDFLFPLDAATPAQIADEGYPGINLAQYGIGAWEPGTVNLTAQAIQQITIYLGRASNAAGDAANTESRIAVEHDHVHQDVNHVDDVAAQTAAMLDQANVFAQDQVPPYLQQPVLDGRYAAKGETMASVEPNMIGAVFSRNMYNPDDPDVERGTVLNGGNPPAPSGLYVTSGWIPVKPNTAYTTYAARKIQFYNADKGYLSPPVDGTSSSELTVTTPATAAFMRVSWFLTAEATIQVEEGDTRTDWVPYGYTLPGFKMPKITADDLPPSPLDILEVETAKNLYNPADATEGVFLAGNSTTPFPIYTTSGFIPVEPGQTYTISSVRSYNWYSDQKVSVDSDTNLGTAQQATITAPSYARFLRLSTLTSNTAQLQVEVGSEATEWEPFGVRIKGLLLPEPPRSTRPVRASLTEDGALSVESYLGDRPLVINCDLNGSANGAFNFVSTTIDGQVFHYPSDDVTPIRAMQTTVGANHGWTSTVTATNPDGKTDADAGSRWTDGVNEYAMLGVQDGKILLGNKPTPRLDGTTYHALRNDPTADLTHVAGATKTATIPISGLSSVQLYPSVRDVSVTADMDGTPLVAGAPLDGDTLTVREHYWIIDYADLYDRIIASPGTPHTAITPNRLATLRVAYQFTGEGRCLVTTSVTANRKMELGACGFVQSGAMSRDGYSLWRRLPGVEPMNGYDLAAGADITNWSESQVVNTSNLTDPTVPPQFTVDTLRDGSGEVLVGFALGYVPDQGDGSITQRLAVSSSRLWDLRSTRKNYPNAIVSGVMESGESLSVSAFRAYLAPDEVGGFSVPDGRGNVAALADTDGFAEVPGLAGRPVSAVYGLATTVDATTGGGVSWSGGWGTARIDK